MLMPDICKSGEIHDNDQPAQTTSPCNREDFIKWSSEVLNAMANGKRLAVLEIISTKEISVGELSQAVGLSPSALSQHLSKMRSAHLISFRREGQTIYYSCSSGAVVKILRLLREMF
jgi:DNA-binding transcriptional ArsR family regulator